MQPEAPKIDPATGGHTLFVLPSGHGRGFEASIRGHQLELADPTDHRLAPNPNDLLVAAIASDVAWSARTLLRGYGLPDDVSVSAGWRTHEDLPSPVGIDVRVAISSQDDGVNEALAAAFANGLAGRFGAELVVHTSFEE